MKSFKDFSYSIVEQENKPRKAYGKPSGYGPGGEPMYTRRPSPEEPGRRAQVQQSPASVASVKREIEAAKGFAGARSGGLETRSVPSKVTQVRQNRATAAGTPDPWFSKAGKKFKLTPQDLEKATLKLGSPMRARGGSQAFSDFVKDFAKETGTSRSEVLRQTVSGIPDTESSFKQIFGQALKTQRRAQLQNPSQPKQLGLFGSDEPIPSKTPKATILEPKTPGKPPAPGQLDIADIKPKASEPPKSTSTSPKKPPTPPKTELGGTPKSVSFSTPSRSKTSGAPKSSVVDVTATTVPGTKFAEPPAKPKNLPGLNLGTEPAGKMVSVRSGQSQTIRPSSRPGVTGTLEKPKAGGMTGAQIEPVKVVDITKPKVTGNVDTSRVTRNYTSTANKVQDIVKSQRRSRQAAERLMSQKFKAGGKLLGRSLGAAGAAYDVYSGYQGEKAKGSGNTRALLKGLTQAAGATIGGIAGGAVVPVAGTIAGATAGSMAGGKLFDVAAGENARERAMRALQRRQSQAGEYFIGKDSTKVTQKGKAGFVSTGTGTDRKTSQLASTKVLKDPVTGKERVGYLAFKTSPAGQKQAVYKAGDTSQDLAKTSSNWLERLGRTYAPSLYSKSDAANERRQLSNARAQQNLMRTKLGMG